MQYSICDSWFWSVKISMKYTNMKNVRQIWICDEHKCLPFKWCNYNLKLIFYDECLNMRKQWKIKINLRFRHWIPFAVIHSYSENEYCVSLLINHRKLYERKLYKKTERKNNPKIRSKNSVLNRAEEKGKEYPTKIRNAICLCSAC